MRANADAFLALPLTDHAKRRILHENAVKIWP
jgi:predicted TIM-barrel fold metal-dependent hydrolase